MFLYMSMVNAYLVHNSLFKTSVRIKRNIQNKTKII